MFMDRYYGGSSCRASINGLRQVGFAPRGIWPLFIIHGCSPVLVLRNVERYYDRGQCTPIPNLCE